MASRAPSCSTAALAPIVEALLSRPGQGRAHVAAPLHSYLRNDLDGDAWHPEADRLDLAAGLAASLTSALPVQGTWAYMGRLWAWCSLGDVRVGIPRGEAGHKLHQVLVPGNPRLTLRRLASVWSSLHDTGELSIDFSDKRAVRATLTHFGAATPESLDMVQGMLIEALRIAGASQSSVQTSSQPQGAVWTLRFQERPQALGSPPPPPQARELDAELLVELDEDASGDSQVA